MVLLSQSFHMSVTRAVNQSVNFFVDYLMGLFVCYFNGVLCFLVTDPMPSFIRYCVTTVSTLQFIVANILFQCWKQIMNTWCFVRASCVMFGGCWL